MTDYSTTKPYKDGVAAAKAAIQPAATAGHCEDLMPCGHHCVHALNHLKGCPK